MPPRSLLAEHMVFLERTEESQTLSSSDARSGFPHTFASIFERGNADPRPSSEPSASSMVDMLAELVANTSSPLPSTVSGTSGGSTSTESAAAASSVPTSAQNSAGIDTAAAATALPRTRRQAHGSRTAAVNSTSSDATQPADEEGYLRVPRVRLGSTDILSDTYTSLAAIQRFGLTHLERETINIVAKIMRNNVSNKPTSKFRIMHVDIGDSV